MPTTLRAPRAFLVVLLVSAATMTACGSAAAPPPASAASSAIPPTSAPPASTDAGTGVGVGGPVDPTPIDPAAGQPALLVPSPGQLNPHPVAPQNLKASVDGRHVLVKVAWYGGIPPCSVLDSVKVDRSGTTITLTVIEGSSDLTAMCAEIAMLKATIVDLGDLDSGTWTITAPNSEAAPITVTIE